MSKIKNVSKKTLLLSILALLVIASGVGLYFKSSNHTKKSPQTSAEQQTINLNPPTEEDKQRAADNKKRIDDREAALKNQPEPQPGTKKSVTPIVTYAEQYGQNVEVGGYIPGIFEDNGTCIATFTQGTVVFNKSVTAIKNANSVNCPVISVGANEFQPKGTWSVKLSYNSATANGDSSAKNFEVK